MHLENYSCSPKNSSEAMESESSSPTEINGNDKFGPSNLLDNLPSLFQLK